MHINFRVDTTNNDAYITTDGVNVGKTLTALTDKAYAALASIASECEALGIEHVLRAKAAELAPKVTPAPIAPLATPAGLPPSGFKPQATGKGITETDDIPVGGLGAYDTERARADVAAFFCDECA